MNTRIEKPGIEKIYRDEATRVLATLIRLLGSFDLAEEAAQEAFAAALQQWPVRGAPEHPRAWLISTGRHKILDLLRRRKDFESKADELRRIAGREQASASAAAEMESTSFMNQDDRLRLIFTCCHPALAMEAQVALTLRTLCGLTTEEIASAFLVPTPAMAQRVVRAKQKIRDAHIPYRVPMEGDLSERLEAVLLVVYLVFNEGYTASSGDALIRRELCAEAIRLGRLLCELLPQRPEARALLALMLLHDSRRDARTSADGQIILLDEQDRSLWRPDQIAEGLELIESALRSGAAGSYALQAAIAAVHARATRAEDTDWRQIVALYDLLIRLNPSPVIELNRAAAVAMTDGPAQGLQLLDNILASGELQNYYLLPAARGDMLRRLARWTESSAAYLEALT